MNGRPALTVSVTKLPRRQHRPGVASEIARRRCRACAAPRTPAARSRPCSTRRPSSSSRSTRCCTEGGLGLGFAVIVILLFLLSRAGHARHGDQHPDVRAHHPDRDAGGAVLAEHPDARAPSPSRSAAWSTTRSSSPRTSPGTSGRTSRASRTTARTAADPRRGAAGGVLAAVREVAGAVTASTATTVAVFLPDRVRRQHRRGAVPALRPHGDHRARRIAARRADDRAGARLLVPPAGAQQAPSRAKRLPPLQRGYRPILSRHAAAPVADHPRCAAGARRHRPAAAPPADELPRLDRAEHPHGHPDTCADGTSLDAADRRAPRRRRGSCGRSTGVRIVDASIGAAAAPRAPRSPADRGARRSPTRHHAADGGPGRAAAADPQHPRRPATGEFQVTTGGGASAPPATSRSTSPRADTAALDTAPPRDPGHGARASPRSRRRPATCRRPSSTSPSSVDATKAAQAGFTEAALAQFVAGQTQPTVDRRHHGRRPRSPSTWQHQDPPTTLDALQELQVPTPTGKQAALDSLATVTLGTGPATVTSTDARPQRDHHRDARPGRTPARRSRAVQQAVDRLTLPAGAAATLGGVASTRRRRSSSSASRCSRRS